MNIGRIAHRVAKGGHDKPQDRIADGNAAYWRFPGITWHERYLVPTLGPGARLADG